MDFSGLDSFLKAKTRAAPPKRKAGGERGGRTKAPYASLPEVLKEILEEQSRQFKAYTKAKEWEIGKYREEYPGFRKFHDIIKREEKTACLIEPGLIDLDLADAIVRLRIERLPSPVRRMALSLVATLERKVTQRETGHPFNDPLPWPLTGPTPRTSSGQQTNYSGPTPGHSSTLMECRLALGLT